jgi:ureidoglycolate lyase
MPSSIPAPNRLIEVSSLTEQAFSQFGSVIQNPAHSTTPSTKQAIAANQGSALKYNDVTNLTNYYTLSPSKKPARSVLNMFVCSPRKLRNTTRGDIFDVKILERHPFTSQTFIPLGLPQDDVNTKYLIIVAPTLPPSRKDLKDRPKPYPTPAKQPKKSLFDIFSRARPSPFTNERSPPTPSPPGQRKMDLPKGPGLPDLANLKAFIADGSQAVTYGPGTWHAPMVVLGQRDVDFVVCQYANGVGIEDCQEVDLIQEGGEGLTVVVDRAGIGGVRARL